MDSETCRAKILSEEYWDFIISANGGRKRLPVLPEDACFQQVDVGYEIAYLEQSLAGPLTFERFSYDSIPQCYTLLDMDAMNQAGISQVQYYPTLELMGEGVMVGFVDTGIDYANQVFRNLDGTTRIAGIWDQTVQTGTAPEGFDYGSAYTQEQINEALRLQTPEELVPTEDSSGHGTFVASLACGSGNVENRFLGAAPEAALAVVKLKPAKSYIRDFYGIPSDAECYQENDIMTGIRYLWDVARSRNMPLVLCIALGTNFGGHSGTSVLAAMLRIYAASVNRTVITGTGNEANQRHHYLGTLEGMNDRREVEIQVGDGVEAFSLELWTELPNLVAISVTSPSGERIPRITLKQGITFFHQFLFERTELYIDNQVLVGLSSAQLIFMRFRAPVPGVWKITVEPLRLAAGDFHIWLPVKEFLTGDVIFLESNPDTTLTCPSSADSVITVSYYNGAENSIDINSGRGYTRVGVIKPDFAAPGVNVTGALPGGRFAKRSGSSAAVAITAGASALLLEWLMLQNVRVGYDTIRLKGLFILGAVQRPDIDYPNKAWGHGTLDLYETLKTVREL